MEETAENTRGSAVLDTSLFVFFFYLGFLSRTFMNHRTAGEVGGGK